MAPNASLAAVAAPSVSPVPGVRTDWRAVAGFGAIAAAGGAAWLLWNRPYYRPLAAVQLGLLLLAAVTYLAGARATLAIGSAAVRSGLFALVNLAGLALFLDWHTGRRRVIFFLAAYVVVVAIQYLAMRRFAERRDWTAWLAFLTPIGVLVFVRYAAFLLDPLWAVVPGIVTTRLADVFIGLSYMAFRLSHLALEVRNRVVPRPSVWEYFGFAFFLPTFAVGPINPYHNHQRSLARPGALAQPAIAVQRIVIGAVKYQVLGNLFNQLSYSGLLLDGHPHHPMDLVVAAVAYHLYLYCNFAGFCDMAIGAAGLLGIRVAENFRYPLAARSVQDYWTRWHITLSVYFRDVVFSPLSKALVRVVPPDQARHAIAAAIVVVFLLVGVWHGVGWQFAAYGAIHAAGVAGNHYYTIWLKRRLGRDRYRAYHENRLITAAAVAITFLYVTASLFFFANDFARMQRIFAAIGS